MVNNTIFFFFLISNFYFLKVLSSRVEPILSKTRANSFLELTRQSGDITIFTDTLRENHVRGFFN